MKIVLAILIFISAMAGFSAITGIQHAHITDTRREIIWASTQNRIVNAGVCVAFAATAYSCATRRRLGWWLIAILLGTIGASGVVTGIVAATETRFLRAYADGATGALLLLALWRYWLPKRAEFEGRG